MKCSQTVIGWILCQLKEQIERQDDFGTADDDARGTFNARERRASGYRGHGLSSSLRAENEGSSIVGGENHSYAVISCSSCS